MIVVFDRELLKGKTHKHMPRPKTLQREKEREGQTVKESFQTDVWCLPFGSSFLLVMKLGFQTKFQVITSASSIQHKTS